MSSGRTMTANSLIGEMFQVGLYKPNQGRITRQTTCGALWLIALIAAWRLYNEFVQNEAMRYSIPLVLVVVGFWMSYRLVNYPRFADFLIAVEAEMNKVSWPSWSELNRNSMVVIFVMFSLSAVLYFLDLLWTFLFANVFQILK